MQTVVNGTHCRYGLRLWRRDVEPSTAMTASIDSLTDLTHSTGYLGYARYKSGQALLRFVLFLRLRSGQALGVPITSGFRFAQHEDSRKGHLRFSFVGFVRIVAANASHPTVSVLWRTMVRAALSTFCLNK